MRMTAKYCQISVFAAKDHSSHFKKVFNAINKPFCICNIQIQCTGLRTLVAQLSKVHIYRPHCFSPSRVQT